MKIKLVSRTMLASLSLATVLAFSSCGGGATENTNAPAKMEQQESSKKVSPKDMTHFKAVPEASKVNWLGKKVTGEHAGTIGLKAGKLSTANGEIQQGKFIFDMNNMTCTDIENEDSNFKLINHLKSEDFFATEKYPEVRYEILSAKKLENGKTLLEGNLTIKDITSKQTAEVLLKEEGNNLMLRGEAEIDRTVYDIKYGSGKFFPSLGDRMINDEFTLSFEIALSNK